MHPPVGEVNFDYDQESFTWDALTNNKGTQARVATDIVGVFVAGSQHHQPIPILLPCLWFGIPTPGSITKGAREPSCVHPRTSNVHKLTMGTVIFEENMR